MNIWKQLVCCCFTALFLLMMVHMAEAGILTFKITSNEAGEVRNGKQAILFRFTVKNVARDQIVRKLNHVIVEVTGKLPNGQLEKYQRKINMNYTFNPALGPRQSKNLWWRFYRDVNSDMGVYKYHDVRVRVVRVSTKKAILH